MPIKIVSYSYAYSNRSYFGQVLLLMIRSKKWSAKDHTISQLQLAEIAFAGSPITYGKTGSTRYFSCIHVTTLDVLSPFDSFES